MHALVEGLAGPSVLVWRAKERNRRHANDPPTRLLKGLVLSEVSADRRVLLGDEPPRELGELGVAQLDVARERADQRRPDRGGAVRAAAVAPLERARGAAARRARSAVGRAALVSTDASSRRNATTPPGCCSRAQRPRHRTA